MGAPGTAEGMEIHASAPRPLALAALAVAVVALPGCTDDARVGTGGQSQRGPGDSLTGQGVEIVRGGFVPELVAVGPAQAVTFVNRDDISHRIAKMSGPGRDFRSPRLDPGESYRVTLVGGPVGSCARARLSIAAPVAAGLPGALPCTARSSRAATIRGLCDPTVSLPPGRTRQRSNARASLPRSSPGVRSRAAVTRRPSLSRTWAEATACVSSRGPRRAPWSPRPAPTGPRSPAARRPAAASAALPGTGARCPAGAPDRAATRAQPRPSPTGRFNRHFTCLTGPGHWVVSGGLTPPQASR
jgi:plastocyanin